MQIEFHEFHAFVFVFLVHLKKAIKAMNAVAFKNFTLHQIFKTYQSSFCNLLTLSRERFRDNLTSISAMSAYENIFARTLIHCTLVI